MVAMATELYKEQQKNRGRDPLKDRIPKKPRVGEKAAGSGIEPWKFKKDGKDKTVSGTKYVWCPHHGHKVESGKQSGMYMQEPHDHADWVKKKEEKLLNWKAKRAANAAGKGGGGGAASPASQARPPNKLALAKSYRQALTTKVGLSDLEAEHIMEEVMKNEGVEDLKD